MESKYGSGEKVREKRSKEQSNRGVQVRTGSERGRKKKNVHF